MCTLFCRHSRETNVALGPVSECENICRAPRLDVCTEQCVISRQIAHSCMTVGATVAVTDPPQTEKPVPPLVMRLPCRIVEEDRVACEDRCDNSTAVQWPQCSHECICNRLKQRKCPLPDRSKCCPRDGDHRRCVADCQVVLEHGQSLMACAKHCLREIAHNRGCKQPIHLTKCYPTHRL